MTYRGPSLNSMRLDRLLSNRGYCTRKDAALLLREGRVSVAGNLAQDRAQDVPSDADVLVDGELIDPGQGVLLIMNKPLGFTCSRQDSGSLIYELLPERYQRRNPPLVTVGRLDKETSGLLLFTDDGAFLHRLTSPKYKVNKFYEVNLESPISEENIELLRSGTLILHGEDKPLLPAQIVRYGERGLKVSICEGRYRQVRRMFEAIGNTVTGLHRLQIGALELGSIEPGEYRILTPAEGKLAQEFRVLKL